MTMLQKSDNVIHTVVALQKEIGDTIISVAIELSKDKQVMLKS